MVDDGLAELRLSARIYTCRCRGDTWQLIGEAEGMSKQSASSRLKTLEAQAERVAIIAAYSPPYLNFLLQTLVQRSGRSLPMLTAIPPPTVRFRRIC